MKLSNVGFALTFVGTQQSWFTERNDQVSVLVVIFLPTLLLHHCTKLGLTISSAVKIMRVAGIKFSSKVTQVPVCMRVHLLKVD